MAISKKNFVSYQVKEEQIGNTPCIGIRKVLWVFFIRAKSDLF